MIIKIYGLGLNGYSKDFFNVFDGCVVILSLIELVMKLATGNAAGGETNAVSSLRAVRIFRTFRVFRVTRLLRS